jgi:hypothetical protein
VFLAVDEIMSYTGITTSIIVVARYNYYAHNDDELTFRKGERFLVVEKSTSHGWFVVERLLEPKGERGLAPGNYFRKETSKTSPAAPPPPAADTSPRKEAIEEEDNEESDVPAPPLPGPPPKWSGTECTFHYCIR